jgi:hypothetical protein
MTDDVSKELNKVMTHALLQIKKLTTAENANQPDFLSIVKTFLLGIFSTTIDLVGLHHPNAASFLYADIEAAAKLGGIREITKWSSSHGLCFLAQ